MKRILTAAALAVTLMGTGGNLAYGQPPEDHFKQAEHHANMAVNQARPGDAGTVVEHAQTALEHLRMAQAQKHRPDLDKAIRSLEQAIQEGKGGDANKAVEHTREALDAMDAAKAAMGG